MSYASKLKLWAFAMIAADGNVPFALELYNAELDLNKLDEDSRSGVVVEQ